MQNSRLKKLVYVAGTSYYGDTGTIHKMTEDTKPNPVGWGPYLVPSVELVSEYAGRGVAIVTAFPGAVYGPDSWYDQLFLNPLFEGKKVIGLQGYDPYFSPIHIKDCARALLHLLQFGTADERYFLVDESPVPASEISEMTAKELRVGNRTQYVPRWLCWLFLGPVLTEYATAHSYFSNHKLRQLGFNLLYPTIQQGVPDVVESWLKKKAAEVHADKYEQNPKID